MTWLVLRAFLGLVCAFCLLLGLGFTTTSGHYWFTIFNDYAATFSLLFIVLFEVVIVSYIYGIKRFVRRFVLCAILNTVTLNDLAN